MLNVQNPKSSEQKTPNFLSQGIDPNTHKKLPKPIVQQVKKRNNSRDSNYKQNLENARATT
ncbi:hypothetical protein J1N35_032388 [Gossypium stocksii]|uniref:Uncharacterized protein n=1 Tax=Gossypium stocksii TaxID=47602 RepID=A0A9D3ZUN2_9ROSI|nr:hypothetical protein J1N35_032388 [Gossypium stocksii]